MHNARDHRPLENLRVLEGAKARVLKAIQEFGNTVDWLAEHGSGAQTEHSLHARFASVVNSRVNDAVELSRALLNTVEEYVVAGCYSDEDDTPTTVDDEQFVDVGVFLPRMGLWYKGLGSDVTPLQVVTAALNYDEHLSKHTESGGILTTALGISPPDVLCAILRFSRESDVPGEWWIDGDHDESSHSSAHPPSRNYHGSLSE